MVTLKHSVEIKTTPDTIFEWLKNLDQHYREWHPDHIRWINITGRLDEGDTSYYEEYLHGKLHKIKFKITKVEENKRIEFKNLFPMSIICPKGSYILEPREESTIFTATLSFRFAWLFSKLAKNRVEAIKTHMKEEGENLKKLLEKRDN
ncbi:MAG: SRPBCC family protein [Candidatus Hodarchaeota archaeon]